MTDSESNITSKIFYASAGSDILRFARTTTDLINIATSVNLLLIEVKKQGGKCVRIISLLKKSFGNTLKHFIICRYC